MSYPLPRRRPDGRGATPSEHDVRASQFLAEMVAEGVAVDANAVQISRERWAIHATVAYDGEIIVAEFDALESAQLAIEQTPRPARAAGASSDPGPDRSRE